MKLFDAVDKVHDAFAKTVISSEYPSKFRFDIIHSLDLLQENKAVLTNSKEVDAFYKAIILYIFEDARPDILPKLVRVISHPYGGNNRHTSNTIEDFCIISNTPLNEDEWPLNTRIAHFEEKGDINLIQGGIFYRAQEVKSVEDKKGDIHFVQTSKRKLDKHQLRFTGKAAYDRAKSLAEQSFDTEVKPAILRELVRQYDYIENKLKTISDTFFYRD